MTHHINAIIGKPEALAVLIDRLGSPKPTALAFDLVIIPLNEQRLDEIATSTESSFDGFTYLTPKMADEIAGMCPAGLFLYIETDYFGGMGGQCAALFDCGAMKWRKAHSTFNDERRWSLFGRLFAKSGASEKSPISKGLAELGVVPADGHDEFDTVGLRRFRTLEVLGLNEE